MPIDFSNLNFENENEKSQGIIKPYKPKPCIKSKTYFNRSSIISQTLPKKEDSHLSHISFLKKKIFSL